MLIKLLSKEWLTINEHLWKRRTYLRYEEIIEFHILKQFDNVSIAALTEKEIADYLQTLKKRGLSSNSILQIISVFKRICAYAVQKGIIERTPIHDLRLPHKQKRIEVFSEYEQRKMERYIIKKKKNQYYGILISFYTGLRIGELLALKWEDIDFKQKTITITKSASIVKVSKKGNPYIGTTKTDSGKRKIPIPKSLIPYFKILKETNKEYVISSGKDGFVKIGNYQRTFALLLKRLNLPHRGFHSLRHTYATIFLYFRAYILFFILPNSLLSPPA